MIDCEREVLYINRLKNLDLKTLKELLKQYSWERDAKLNWNGMQIDALERVIKYKEANIIKKYKECPNRYATNMNSSVEDNIITIDCKCGWKINVNENGEEIE